MDVDARNAVPVHRVASQSVGEVGFCAAGRMHDQHVEAELRESLGDIEYVFADAATRRLAHENDSHRSGRRAVARHVDARRARRPTSPFSATIQAYGTANLPNVLRTPK